MVPSDYTDYEDAVDYSTLPLRFFAFKPGAKGPEYGVFIFWTLAIVAVLVLSVAVTWWAMRRIAQPPPDEKKEAPH